MSSEPEQHPLIDEEQVGMLVQSPDGGVDPEIVEIFQDSQKEFVKWMDKVEGIMFPQENSTFVAMAHQMRGTMGNFGFKRFSATLHALEKNPGVLAGEGKGVQLQQLRQEFEDSMQALRKLCPDLFS